MAASRSPEYPMKEWAHQHFRMPQPEMPDYICWGIIIVLLVIIHFAAN